MGVPNINYSKSFMQILNNKELLNYYLAGFFYISKCDHFFVNFSIMVDVRYIVSKPINSNGSLLDIGCSNAFLLGCLQEWSDYIIEPYGIDKDIEKIRLAKELFTFKSKNFAIIDLFDMVSPNSNILKEHKFPKNYNFIYWNVWDDIKFDNKSEIDIIFKLKKLIKKKGRLILGFYQAGNKNHNKFQKKRISKLYNFGIKISGKFEDSYGNIIIWINK